MVFIFQEVFMFLHFLFILNFKNVKTSVLGFLGFFSDPCFSLTSSPTISVAENHFYISGFGFSNRNENP